MSNDLRVGGRYSTPDGLEFVVLEIHDDGSVWVESGPNADYVNAGWYRPTGEETSMTRTTLITREQAVRLAAILDSPEETAVEAQILGEGGDLIVKTLDDFGVVRSRFTLTPDGEVQP